MKIKRFAELASDDATEMPAVENAAPAATENEQ